MMTNSIDPQIKSLKQKFANNSKMCQVIAENFTKYSYVILKMQDYQQGFEYSHEYFQHSNKSLKN